MPKDNIEKLSIKITGGASSLSKNHFPANLPTMANLIQMKIEQSARSLRWERINLDSYPKLEEIHYFFDRGLQRKSDKYRITIPPHSLVVLGKGKF